MKTLFILLFSLIFFLEAKSQTTISVKNKSFIKKITGSNKCHCSFAIEVGEASIWMNQYQGKWYSNYPYKIIMKNGLYKIYNGEKCICIWDFSLNKMVIK